MRSPSQYSFARLPKVEVPRSSFKRDRSYKSAFDTGYLIPFFTDEVYPGDTFNVHTTAFARLSTPLCPFMDNMYMDFFYFFVPYRLIWSNWNKFLGEQENPDDSTDYLTPIISEKHTSGGVAKYDKNLKGISSGSLFDFLGFPVGTFGSPDYDADVDQPATDGIEINAFLPRAYNKIWNDHFRDENLQDRVPENRGDGPDDKNDYTLLRRGKRKDYLTSCLPWPQKGPGAELSIGQSAPIKVTGGSNPFTLTALRAYDTVNPDLEFPMQVYTGIGANDSGGAGIYFGDGDREDDKIAAFSGSKVVKQSQFNLTNEDTAEWYADLATVSPISVNDLRMAVQLQRLMEKDARGGTRLPEIILTHFGVVCPDFRLQRSEFLGGGEIPINIHQVLQTSSTDATSPQGSAAAYGVATGRVGFSKSFVEHGVVIGLVSVRADLNYQQGLHRSWSRRSKYDYYWPSLAHLGEQAVLNKEIYATGNLAQDNAAFGYQERYAELRYGQNQITGKLRSGVSGSLDIWHLAQYFENLPTLNATFIQDNPPVSRVLAVEGEPQIIFDSLTTCNCVRPMPIYSIPGLVDHF